jgi:hypothetical protein
MTAITPLPDYQQEQIVSLQSDHRQMRVRSGVYRVGLQDNSFTWMQLHLDAVARPLPSTPNALNFEMQILPASASLSNSQHLSVVHGCP